MRGPRSQSVFRWARARSPSKGPALRAAGSPESFFGLAPRVLRNTRAPIRREKTPVVASSQFRRLMVGPRGKVRWPYDIPPGPSSARPIGAPPMSRIRLVLLAFGVLALAGLALTFIMGARVRSDRI